jgi:hypothetical protein
MKLKWKYFNFTHQPTFCIIILNEYRVSRALIGLELCTIYKCLCMVYSYTSEYQRHWEKHTKLCTSLLAISKEKQRARAWTIFTGSRWKVWHYKPIHLYMITYKFAVFTAHWWIWLECALFDVYSHSFCTKFCLFFRFSGKSY